MVTQLDHALQTLSNRCANMAGCGDLGDTLMNDACSGFVSYVKASNEYYYDKSNDELQAFVQKTPNPSAQ